MYLQKVKGKKWNFFLVGILSVTDENIRIRIRIRIRKSVLTCHGSTKLVSMYAFPGWSLLIFSFYSVIYPERFIPDPDQTFQVIPDTTLPRDQVNWAAKPISKTLLGQYQYVLVHT